MPKQQKKGGWASFKERFASFKTNYPKTWMLLKHVLFPGMLGAAGVGAIALSGGTASVPFFATMVAKVGLESFYAISAAVIGVSSSWLGHVLADITNKQKLNFKIATTQKVALPAFNGKMQFDPKTLVEFGSLPLEVPKLINSASSTTASIYPRVAPINFNEYSPLPRFETASASLYPQREPSPTLEEPLSFPRIARIVRTIMTEDPIETQVKHLANEVIKLLEQQSSSLKGRLSQEAFDTDDFVKKYGGESDLLATLQRNASSFSNPDAPLDLIISKYTEFRALAKSPTMQHLQYQKDLQRLQQQEKVQKREQKKIDERRTKMGLSAHPLSD